MIQNYLKVASRNIIKRKMLPASAQGVMASFGAGNKVFTEKLAYVDGDFFKMFSFKLLLGNPEKLFQNKSDLVLTPAIARKYFDDEDTIGKTVQIDNEGEKSFTASAK